MLKRLISYQKCFISDFGGENRSGGGEVFASLVTEYLTNVDTLVIVLNLNPRNGALTITDKINNRNGHTIVINNLLQYVYYLILLNLFLNAKIYIFSEKWSSLFFRSHTLFFHGATYRRWRWQLNLNRWKNNFFWLNFKLNNFLRKIFKIPCVYITSTEKNVSDFINEVGVPYGKVVVKPLPVLCTTNDLKASQKKFQDFKKNKYLPVEFLICDNFVNKGKRLDLVLEFCAKVKDFGFNVKIIGFIPNKEKLFLNRLNNVALFGNISIECVLRKKISNVFYISFSEIDTYGLSYLESVVIGCISFCTPLGHHKNFIPMDLQNYLVFENVDDLIIKIRQILDNKELMESIHLSLSKLQPKYSLDNYMVDIL